MLEVRDKISTVLETDAQDTTSGRLGNLLGKSASSPYYGIVLAYPKVEITPPYLAFRNILSTDDNTFDRNMTFVDLIYEFIAVGNNFEQILDRVYQLFHKRILTGLTNDRIISARREWTSEDIFDEKLYVYTKKTRYIFKSNRKQRFA